MKKLSLLFVTLFAAINTFGQNGSNEILTPPNTTTPYILVDTLFTLADYPNAYTDVYIHFANPTADDIKAVQFRLFYDNTNFTTPEIYWGPTATSITDKYGSYFASSDYINVIASYTGNTANFNWADGAMFKLRLYHTTTYQGVVDSIAIVGSTSYNNLATKDNGVDVTLGMYNYGGNFQMNPFTFPIKVRNADGSNAQGVWFTASKRLKSDSQGSWTAIVSDSTNSNGLIEVVHPIDTNFWHLRVVAQTDTMTDGSALSVVDAYKLANAASMQDTLTGIELYEGDINESDDITISDAFAMFNRLALGSTNWNSLFTNTYNVSVLWPSEFTSANSATSVPTWANTPRVYAIDTIVNSLDSLKPYIYVVGDATTTGYNNPAVLIAKMANPGTGTDYILDPAIYMNNIDDTIQFHIPKLVITSDETMEVPVTMMTFGNKIGAAQMGIEFDTSIFRFNSINMGDGASKWTSMLSVQENTVFWAGHEDKMNPSVITDMTTTFTFVFDVINPIGWQTSPLKIFNKAAGDENAYDLNIKPSPNDGSVVNKRDIDADLLDLMQGFKVYPNPTSDAYDNWVFIEHHNDLEGSTLNAMVYDMFGREVMNYSDIIYERGFQFHGFRMTDLPEGMYLVRLVTPDREKFYRIVKY